MAHNQNEVLLAALIAGLISALFTGLGAIPVALLRTDSTKVAAFSSAAAGGMMIGASVLSLVQKGMGLHDFATVEVVIGLLLGAVFLSGCEHFHPEEEDPDGNGASKRGLFVFVAMLFHSFPEGLAIGIGFATGDAPFGLLMALAIAVHNIPEGVAISLAMRADGASIPKCALYSIASSMPQPIMAVPAAYAAWLFKPLMPLGLGFAAGAMLYLVVSELIPEALETSKAIASWGVIIGFCAMLALTNMLTVLTANATF